ncbi:MAG TPA: amidohydrolase family protein, partial [Candidatus Paceibacterota bacterium]
EERDLTDKETEVFKRILNKALYEGAMGLSSGLGYAHGRHISNDELKRLVGVVKESDAIYSTHLRNETNNLLDSVEETINIAKETGAKVLISHLRPLNGYESKFDKAMELIDKNLDSANIYFYVYPFDISLNSIYTLLPIWAQERNLETMLYNIRNSEMALKIERDMPEFNPNDIKIVDAPKNDYLVGKTIAQSAENLGLSHKAALLKVMDITGLKAVVANRNINFDYLVKLLPRERVLIASNSDSRRSSSDFVKNERSLNTFPRYLKLAVQNNSMLIEEAIKKITMKPAELFGLKKRGVVKERYIADLVLINKSDFGIIRTIVGGGIGGQILRHYK